MSESESGGKGRATKSRKQAEAERKAQLKPERGSKAAKSAERERMYEQRRAARLAMYTNDERLLNYRDRGPTRRFLRNFVDSRLTVGEMFVPLAFIIVLAMAIPSPAVQQGAFMVWEFAFIGIFVDTVWLYFRAKRALLKEQPDAETRGMFFYVAMRAITLRLMRLPRPLVKLGGAPNPVKIPKSLR